ncbi:MAG: sensor histidine kinase [Bradyrhizobium sp.]
MTSGVQSSLDELRLLIDARSASTDTLVDAISNLRHRLDSRLVPLGVETEWEVVDGAEDLILGAEATLYVLRIVQEGVSNAVRHGRATRIVSRISHRCLDKECANDAKALRGVLSITDNGCGPERASSSSKGNGHGLKSMKLRAAALGGEFNLQRIDLCTRAELTFTCS